MTTAQLLSSALAGLGLGLGLIVPIGAQNAFVLRQGVTGEHVRLVVLVCIVSDALLIAAGVGGAGGLVTAMPGLLGLARYAGAAFLAGYALLAARRAWLGPDGAGLRAVADGAPSAAAGLGAGVGQATAGDKTVPPGWAVQQPGPLGRATTVERPPAVRPAERADRRRVGPVLATVVGLTWLNPHVYLDTVVLLGSVGSTHGTGRWAFAAGAIAGSVLWFCALGLAARALAPLFARPRAWQILDGAVAVVMVGVAVGLVSG